MEGDVEAIIQCSQRPPPEHNESDDARMHASTLTPEAADGNAVASATSSSDIVADTTARSLAFPLSADDRYDPPTLVQETRGGISISNSDGDSNASDTAGRLLPALPSSDMSASGAGSGSDSDSGGSSDTGSSFFSYDSDDSRSTCAQPCASPRQALSVTSSVCSVPPSSVPHAPPTRSPIGHKLRRRDTADTDSVRRSDDEEVATVDDGHDIKSPASSSPMEQVVSPAVRKPPAQRRDEGEGRAVGVAPEDRYSGAPVHDPSPPSSLGEPPLLQAHSPPAQEAVPWVGGSNSTSVEPLASPSELHMAQRSPPSPMDGSQGGPRPPARSPPRPHTRSPRPQTRSHQPQPCSARAQTRSPLRSGRVTHGTARPCGGTAAVLRFAAPPPTTKQLTQSLPLYGLLSVPVSSSICCCCCGCCCAVVAVAIVAVVAVAVDVVSRSSLSRRGVQRSTTPHTTVKPRMQTDLSCLVAVCSEYPPQRRVTCVPLTHPRRGSKC